MSYTPKTLGQVYDLLGFMVLSGPEMRSSIDPTRNVETCFEQLRQGLLTTRRKVGENGYHRLQATADEAHELYTKGLHPDGSNLLQHMEEYIRLGKYQTNEPVVDEARFEPRS